MYIKEGKIIMLERFLVKKLFGLFDNEIVFNKDGSTILVGPNGCGKTTMLNMIKFIFVKNHYRLFEYEFEYIEFTINGQIIKLEKGEIEQKDDFNDEINTVKCIRYSLNGEMLDEEYTRNRRTLSPSFWEKQIPDITRVSSKVFRDLRTMKYVNIEDMMEKYFGELTESVQREILNIPLEILKLLNEVNVELISTNRLMTITSNTGPRYDVLQTETVEIFSEELKEKISKVLSEYANLSQRLDAKFPTKIINAIKEKKHLSEEELKEKSVEIENIRKKHIETGILEENEEDYLNVNLDGIDYNTASILTVYYEDTKIKLEYLNEISNQIKIFMEMLNKKLSPGKELLINGSRGISVIQKQQNRNIRLNNLSSGEQQEIVLLYELIFKTDKNTLVLIDEPEISLNVKWQRDFLEDISKIIDMNKSQVLIATHSPQIIGDRWDIVSNLGKVD